MFNNSSFHLNGYLYMTELAGTPWNVSPVSCIFSVYTRASRWDITCYKKTEALDNAIQQFSLA